MPEKSQDGPVTGWGKDLGVESGAGAKGASPSFPKLPAGWQSRWEMMPSHDGLHQLYVATHFRAEKPGPRTLVVIHGHGEHGGRYLHLPHYLGDAIDRMVCLDLRGHGKSEGTRGHLEGEIDLYTDDVVDVISLAQAAATRDAGVPAVMHLLGHSMGGLIVLRALVKRAHLPLQTITACSPFIGIAQAVPAAKKIAAKLLSRAWPSLQLSTGLDEHGVSHDLEVVEAYGKDRLNHDKMTPGLYEALLRAFADTLASHRAAAPYAFQMLLSLADPIVDANCSQRFFDGLEHPGKELHGYEGFFHEALNELEKEKPLADLRQWIVDHNHVIGSTK